MINDQGYIYFLVVLVSASFWLLMYFAGASNSEREKMDALKMIALVVGTVATYLLLTTLITHFW